MTFKLVPLALALTFSLAGCGAALSRAATPGDATAAMLNPGTASTGTAHQRGRRGAGIDGLLNGKLVQQLGLSADQKTQIKAVFAANRPAAGAKPDLAALKAKHDAFQQVLAADPLDTAALTSLLADRQAQAAGRQAKMADSLVAVRNILTAEQRTKAADLLTQQGAQMGQHKPPAGGAPHGPRAGGSGHGPQLTDAQKAGLKALMAKRQAAHKPGDRLAALATFLRDGNRDALVASMTQPTDNADVVAFLATLSPEQRTKLGGFLLGGGGPRGHRGGGFRRGPKPAAG